MEKRPFLVKLEDLYMYYTNKVLLYDPRTLILTTTAIVLFFFIIFQYREKSRQKHKEAKDVDSLKKSKSMLF